MNAMNSALTANRLCVAGLIAALSTLSLPGVGAAAQSKSKSKTSDAETVSDEHALIGVGSTKSSSVHIQHPDAQWYPDAGLGLFIHWNILGEVDEYLLADDPRARPRQAAH
jgi:hypothetical protein